MDRSVIQERLAETEEQIANGENQIAQQRRLIAELETNGSPASHAKYLLAGIAFSRKVASYSPRLRSRSHAPTSMVAPLPVMAHTRAENLSRSTHP